MEQKLITSPGLQMDESTTSTKWTDEKHSLYLDSMEASFVNELYNYESFSMNLLGGDSEKRDIPLKKHHGHVTSGQFKVLQDGCWRKVNFNKDRPEMDIKDESHVLPRSPWIQHFRAAHKYKNIKSLYFENNCNRSIESIGFGRKRKPCYGITASSEQLPACHAQLFYQNLAGNTAEGSDQNFVDKEHEEDLSNIRDGKRMKPEVADKGILSALSGKDSQVPSHQPPKKSESFVSKNPE